MIDLSHVGELASLAHVLRQFQHATQHLADRSFIVGATARDLILHHAYGLRITRATADLDIAVAVRSWEAFRRLEDNFIREGARRIRNAVHQFSIDDWKIDVLPFGKVERDGIIIWPETEARMSVEGFDEASTHALEVLLSGGTRVFVASPPGLLMLKLIAWKERHLAEAPRDAIDIRTLIDSYGESWNEDRLYSEADDLLQKFGYDNSLAGAALIGRDCAAIAKPSTLAHIRAIVERETSDESFVLARDMGGRVEKNLALLEAVRTGLADPYQSVGL